MSKKYPDNLIGWAIRAGKRSSFMPKLGATYLNDIEAITNFLFKRAYESNNKLDFEKLLKEALETSHIPLTKLVLDNEVKFKNNEFMPFYEKAWNAISTLLKKLFTAPNSSVSLKTSLFVAYLKEQNLYMASIFFPYLDDKELQHRLESEKTVKNYAIECGDTQ